MHSPASSRPAIVTRGISGELADVVRILTGIGTHGTAEAFGRAYQHHCSLPCTTQRNRYGSSLCRKNQHSPLHQKTSCPLQRSTRIGLGYGRGYSSWPSSSRDSSVRCEEKAGTRICCSQDDFKSSHGCCNQGQAIYTKSTRTRVVTMCQNQGQTIYTRNARTRTVAIKLNMPNPFFALALGLCTRAKSTRRNGGRHHFVPL